MTNRIEITQEAYEALQTAGVPNIAMEAKYYVVAGDADDTVSSTAKSGEKHKRATGRKVKNRVRYAKDIITMASNWRFMAEMLPTHDRAFAHAVAKAINASPYEVMSRDLRTMIDAPELKLSKDDISHGVSRLIKENILLVNAHLSLEPPIKAVDTAETQANDNQSTPLSRAAWPN